MRKINLITAIACVFLLFTGNSYSDTTPPTTSTDVVNEKLQMAENNPIANTFCRVYDTVLATAFVIAAILWTVTGVGFFIGKISWGIVVAITVGSALTVGSSKLAAQFVFGNSDLTEACECRYGIDCESPYE